MDKRGNLNLLHLIVGILLIGGGILYIFGQNSLGAVIAGLGVFVEILLNWIKQI
jgi:uncharacterized MnhB-related membrane protein